jgi:hypothetical protein
MITQQEADRCHTHTGARIVMQIDKEFTQDTLGIVKGRRIREKMGFSSVHEARDWADRVNARHAKGELPYKVGFCLW